MLLGSDALGRYAVGQVPDNNGFAEGVTLDVAATLIAGIASVETAPVRMVGGSAFTSQPHTAQGATITVGTSIIPGEAQVGHEIVFTDKHGRTTRKVTLFGFTDEQLCSDDLTIAVALDDWDWWQSRQHEEAA